MSDRKYKSYKFYYDDDLGRTIIKRHRSYLNEDGVTEDTPITQLFRDRVVETDGKVTGTSKGLRHVDAVINAGTKFRNLIAKIPYAPSDPKLIDHILEIFKEPQVECGDYIGERLLSGGSTNSIQ